MTRVMTARGRGLARLVGKPGMLAWLARHPDMGPVWADGFSAGFESGRVAGAREEWVRAEAAADAADREYSAMLQALGKSPDQVELERRRAAAVAAAGPGKSGPQLRAEAARSWGFCLLGDRLVPADQVDQRRLPVGQERAS